MKKFYKLLSLIVLLAMVFLALSCSDRTEIPYAEFFEQRQNVIESNDIGEVSSKICKIIIHENCAYVIYIDVNDKHFINQTLQTQDGPGDLIIDDGNIIIDTSNYAMLDNESKSYLLLLFLLHLVENEMIEFNNKKMAIAYKNKLLVLINMIINNNIVGAKQKGINDLHKHLSWIVKEEQQLLFEAYLFITFWILDNPGIDVYYPLAWGMCVCKETKTGMKSIEVTDLLKNEGCSTKTNCQKACEDNYSDLGWECILYDDMNSQQPNNCEEACGGSSH